MTRNPRSNRIDRALLTLIGYNTQGDIGPWTCYTNRKRKLVVFEKAPPEMPPSYLQLKQRNRFRRCARLWWFLTQTQRDNWELVSTRARLRITGFNLFTYWYLTDDNDAIDTLAHQTGTEPRLVA